MKEILEKLKILLKDLEQEYGEIFFFALFLREDALGKWDLLVSAPWLNAHELASYEKITKSAQECLNEKEMLQLARVAVLNTHDPSVLFLQDLYFVPNGSFMEVSNCEPLTERFGFVIKRAYVLKSVDPKRAPIKYHFKIHRENDKFWAECLELEGCLTQADSLEELHEMMKDALNVYISEPKGSKRLAQLPDDSIKKSKNIAEVTVDADIALSFLKRLKNRGFFTTENTKHTEKRN